MNDEKILIHTDHDLEDLIPNYMEHRRSDMARIEAALEDGDFETIRVLAHGMKGSGAGYGFDAVTGIGGRMEKAAEDGDPAEIERCIGELSTYLERVKIVYD